MNPRWEDVRGKSVGLNTLISMPHFSPPQPALEGGLGRGPSWPWTLPRRAQLQASSLGPSQGFWVAPLLREKLRVGGTSNSAARRWDFNHIIGLSVLQFPRLCKGIIGMAHSRC